LYWEVCGNPEGIPAIVLHGGPGAIASPVMRRYFDPERYFVLLFDQRGAMRSRPPGEWRENTTQLLIEDINTLREHVGIQGPAVLVGGSWGTTLALAYAETHPSLVAGMVLRGVFLGTRVEVDHFYHGGVSARYPENWERLRSILPAPDRFDYPRQLFELTTGDDPEIRRRAVAAWAYYEFRMAWADMTDARAEEMVAEYGDSLMPFAVLENFYAMNGYFLEEGQILSDVGRIADIPTYIVHGRLDPICHPGSAEELARHLRHVTLNLTDGAGHAENEPANLEGLLAGIRWVAEQIRREESPD
jgi:proline iminopeptidase